MNFLCLSTAVVVSLIIVIAVQYAFAVFCLLKLAYLDIPKKQYVLWNVFILLVFFIGDIAFLIYYYKVGRHNLIPPYTPSIDEASAEEKAEPDNKADDDTAQKSEEHSGVTTEEKPQAEEQSDEMREPTAEEPQENNTEEQK